MINYVSNKYHERERYIQYLYILEIEWIIYPFTFLSHHYSEAFMFFLPQFNIVSQNVHKGI